MMCVVAYCALNRHGPAIGTIERLEDGRLRFTSHRYPDGHIGTSFQEAVPAEIRRRLWVRGEYGLALVTGVPTGMIPHDCERFELNNSTAPRVPARLPATLTPA